MIIGPIKNMVIILTTISPGKILRNRFIKNFSPDADRSKLLKIKKPLIIKNPRNPK